MSGWVGERVRGWVRGESERSGQVCVRLCAARAGASLCAHDERGALSQFTSCAHCTFFQKADHTKRTEWGMPG